MRTIPLTQGFVALVDDEDYEALVAYRWCAQFSHDRLRVVAVRGRPGGGLLLMHRVILDPPAGMDVDHIRHLPLDLLQIDNQRVNLRAVSRRLNNANRRKGAGTSSRFKGVTWHAGKWMAQIKRPNGGPYLGRYIDEVEAALAYDRAAVESFGPHALTNFAVPGSERWLFS